ncbi:MAG TPA: hypothetical protein VMU80_16745 [Bryobacteraceae bacterium]|nr:hypothetical protein [Bryobacteraceae bacterium]
MKTCVVWLVMAIALTAAARAGEVPVDLSSLANEPWTFSNAPGGASVYNPNTFPIGAQSFGGVPFVIPAPNNYWNGAAAADFGPGVVSLTIPVGEYGVTSAFTLINTFWGFPGPTPYLHVTFNGSDGATFTVPLVGDVNVRDYNQDGNTNTINNTSTIQVWDNGLGQRLDRQEYVLPKAFASQTLTSVTITDSGSQGSGTNGSRAIFSGLTVSTCPVYVTETLTVEQGSIIYHPEANVYTQAVRLTNTGTAAIEGPVFFVLENLPAGVTLVKPGGRVTNCLAPLGSPYAVALPQGSSLAPSTSVDLVLAFSDPSATAISYVPLTAGSLGGLP